MKEKKIYKQKTCLKDVFDFNAFIKNSSINTTTMIIRRSILGTHRFKKIRILILWFGLGIIFLLI